jgi:hypothetical protein
MLSQLYQAPSHTTSRIPSSTAHTETHLALQEHKLQSFSVSALFECNIKTDISYSFFYSLRPVDPLRKFTTAFGLEKYTYTHKI